MGFRMRKRITVAPGVRVNVSKRGIGASVGGKGGRYSVHSSGRRTVSAGSGVIPGVYYLTRGLHLCRLRASVATSDVLGLRNHATWEDRRRLFATPDQLS
jgi:hypothetical protein